MSLRLAIAVAVTCAACVPSQRIDPPSASRSPLRITPELGILPIATVAHEEAVDNATAFDGSSWFVAWYADELDLMVTRIGLDGARSDTAIAVDVLGREGGPTSEERPALACG